MNVDSMNRTENEWSSRWVVTLATVVVFMWASAFVAVRIAVQEVSASHLALARYLVASLVFGLLAVFRRPRWPARSELLRLAAAGAIGISVYNVALNMGQRTVGAGLASLLVNTVPVWTALLAAFFLHERIPSRGWIGTVVAFTGAVTIGLQRGAAGTLNMGTLLVLVAALSQAGYFVITKPLLERYHPIDVTGYAVWLGTIILLPFSGGVTAAIGNSSPVVIGAIVFLGVGPAALAYLAWSFVLKALPAGKAANILFLVPVVAVGMGWLALGEVPTTVSLIGGGITILGVFICNGAQR